MSRLTYLRNDHTDELIAKFGDGGWIKFLLRTIKHRNFQGGWTTYKFPWAVLERGDSVAILLHDSIRDEIVIVEQFRPAILRTIFEIVAGTIKPGEDHTECVIREVWEEVELTVSNIEHISTFFVSPGATSERLFLYYAEVNSLGENGLISGLQEEGENILKHVYSLDTALEMVSNGDIDDAKTIIALLWLKDRRLHK